MTKTLYQILNVSESVSDQELHQAFKTLEQQLLLEENDESRARLNVVREAFLLLSVPTKRLAYDQKLAGERLVNAAPQEIEANAGWGFLQKFRSPWALVAIVALFIYWHLENKKLELAEITQQAQQADYLSQSKEQALQTELDRQDHLKIAEQQLELEQKRLEMETNQQQEAKRNAQILSEMQLRQQEQENERNAYYQEKQSQMAASRQELEAAEKNQELQYRQTNMALQLKQQAAENAAAIRQRDLQQLDENIQSIKDLQAARLRDFDRNHYGSGGQTKTNPAYE